MIERRNFLGLPEEYARYERARYVVLPVPYERAVSPRQGTRGGPSALLTASQQVDLFDEELGFEPWKAGIHTLPPPPILRDFPAFLKSLTDLVEPHVRAGKFLLAIGGENSVTEGTLAAVSRSVPTVSVLHIGAHCELREPHGAVRRLLPYAEKIVQVGIRSMSVGTQRIQNVRTFLAQGNRDVEALAPEAIGELGESVYLSIDLSGLDPSIVPGVRRAVPGGLGWWETLYLLREVVRARTMVAADVVELCPLPDTDISEFAAARLVYRLIGYLVHKEAQKDTVRRPRTKNKGKR